MSHKQQLETEINKLPLDDQYLVRECAHELQRVLDRYQQRRQQPPTALALDLVAAHRLDSIRY